MKKETNQMTFTQSISNKNIINVIFFFARNERTKNKKKKKREIKNKNKTKR